MWGLDRANLWIDYDQFEADVATMHPLLPQLNHELLWLYLLLYCLHLRVCAFGCVCARVGGGVVGEWVGSVCVG